MYDFGSAPKQPSRSGTERGQRTSSSGGGGGTKERVTKDMSSGGYSRRNDADERMIDVTPAPAPAVSPSKHKRQAQGR